jgi:hypothetical protein
MNGCPSATTHRAGADDGAVSEPPPPMPIVFDRLSPDQVRAFGEVCETILTGLTGPDRPADANLPWRR